MTLIYLNCPIATSSVGIGVKWLMIEYYTTLASDLVPIS